MKYPISLNEKELEQIKQIGQAMDIKDINNVYGAIPKIIKFSINLTKQTIEKLEKAIPDVNPEILDILLSAIKRKKLLKYHRQKHQRRFKHTK